MFYWPKVSFERFCSEKHASRTSTMDKVSADKGRLITCLIHFIGQVADDSFNSLSSVITMRNPPCDTLSFNLSYEALW